MPIPAGVDGAPPEWIHLLPAGEIRTADGRGPYKVKSMPALAIQLNAASNFLIDECHATDLAAPKGEPAPARAWVKEFEARPDGLWGRADWTGAGVQLMADKSYRFISPAVLHDKNMNVLGVLRASLTNKPNLVGLTALHSEEDVMDWKAKLIELLGLDSGADDAAIDAALKALKEKADKPAEAAPALQSAQDILGNPVVVALQGEITSLTDQVNALTQGDAKRAAIAFVDGAIVEGRAGVKPLRDEYISLHMANPAQAEKLIGGMPKLGGSTHAGGIAPTADAEGLTPADRTVMALMGLNEDEYKASLAATGQKVEAL